MPRPDPARLLLLELAAQHGIRAQVAELVEGRRGPRRETLAKLLRDQRNKHDISTTTVCARSNLSRCTLSKLETGKHAKVGVRTVQALAYGYRLPFVRVLLAAMNSKH